MATNRPPAALKQLLNNVTFTYRDLAALSAVHERSIWYWLAGQRYPIARNRLKIAQGIRKQAARMLVSARMLEESVRIDPADEVSVIFDRLGTPENLTKQEATLYKEILGLEATYRKRKTNKYTEYVAIHRRQGHSMKEVAQMWRQEHGRGE